MFRPRAQGSELRVDLDADPYRALIAGIEQTFEGH